MSVFFSCAVYPNSGGIHTCSIFIIARKKYLNNEKKEPPAQLMTGSSARIRNMM